MKENWQRVQSLFLEAAELSPEERVRFLDNACAGEADIRREVESLLTHDGASEERIAGALAGAAQSLFHAVTLKPGTRVGDYEVHKLIGSGGMGEVHQARDLRLARNVAIKVLPSFLTNDPDRLRRFEQEARAAAALNHPNIIAVYQMGFYEGAPYLVSELLEGDTLRDLIKEGPLPWRNAIEYGVQIVRGLAAAHSKGITHRDLKPENVFLTSDGRVKILDFGLARREKLLSAAERTRAPTVTLETLPGTVTGTVGYMSPEQVTGQPGDARSDIFSFGCLLYEMVTGQRAFSGRTGAETMAAILKEDPPDPLQSGRPIPPDLARVIAHCLRKELE